MVLLELPVVCEAVVPSTRVVGRVETVDEVVFADEGFRHELQATRKSVLEDTRGRDLTNHEPVHPVDDGIGLRGASREAQIIERADGRKVNVEGKTFNSVFVAVENDVVAVAVTYAGFFRRVEKPFEERIVDEREGSAVFCKECVSGMVRR